ncbi:MAG: DUF58 domain-containing protein [Chloroflexota bacterium]
MFFDRLLRRRGAIQIPLAHHGLPRGGPGEEIDDGFLSRLRNVALASQRRLTSGLTGEHASPRRANALEFADYRSYTPGDDFRRVDWNAYLRLDHLLVKLSDAPERLTLHLLVDTSSSMAWGHPSKFGYARRVAAGLAYVALSHMDAASLMVLNGQDCLRLARQESSAAAGRMVRAVNSLRPGGTTDLDTALSAYTALANHRGVAVLISDLLSPAGYQSGLERLSRTALRPVVIHLLSPEEMNPSLEGDLELLDVETGDSVQVSIDWATLKRYRRWLREWLEEIESFCSRRGITYVRVETSQPVEHLLLDRLRREKVLK